MSEDKPETWTQGHNKGFDDPYGHATTMAQRAGQEDALRQLEQRRQRNPNEVPTPWWGYLLVALFIGVMLLGTVAGYFAILAALASLCSLVVALVTLPIIVAGARRKTGGYSAWRLYGRSLLAGLMTSTVVLVVAAWKLSTDLDGAGMGDFVRLTGNPLANSRTTGMTAALIVLPALVYAAAIKGRSGWLAGLAAGLVHHAILFAIFLALVRTVVIVSG